jgi:cubilin
VTIVFQSDQSTARAGFTASLSFMEADKLCGANYFTSFGAIKSPGSTEYLANKNCEWVITVPIGRQIELNFKELDIEPHASCRFDGLEVRNGGTSLAPLIGLFCGTEKPAKIRSFGKSKLAKLLGSLSNRFAIILYRKSNLHQILLRRF